MRKKFNDYVGRHLVAAGRFYELLIRNLGNKCQLNDRHFHTHYTWLLTESKGKFFSTASDWASRQNRENSRKKTEIPTFDPKIYRLRFLWKYFHSRAFFFPHRFSSRTPPLYRHPQKRFDRSRSTSIGPDGRFFCEPAESAVRHSWNRPYTRHPAKGFKDQLRNTVQNIEKVQKSSGKSRKWSGRSENLERISNRHKTHMDAVYRFCRLFPPLPIFQSQIPNAQNRIAERGKAHRSFTEFRTEFRTEIFPSNFHEIVSFLCG